MNIKETIQLLGIQDVTTPRQKKNGTVTWKLPIKRWGKFIEVASFKSGYVRNNNCGYRNYQLNKCKMSKRYYQYANGKVHEFDTKERILIPKEQDRLEYLISYCLKNYYIGKANQVANGDYVPKWKHEDELQYARKLEDKVCNPEVKVIVNGHRYNVI